MSDYRTVVLDGEINLNLAMDGECGIVTEVYRSDYPFYSGPTSVNPSFESVVLETAETVVMDDITVNPIQVESVSNPTGGRTVYIGGIV